MCEGGREGGRGGGREGEKKREEGRRKGERGRERENDWMVMVIWLFCFLQHSVCVVYRGSKMPWQKGDMQLFVDGKLRKTAAMKGPNLSDVRPGKGREGGREGGWEGGRERGREGGRKESREEAKIDC